MLLDGSSEGFLTGLSVFKVSSLKVTKARLADGGEYAGAAYLNVRFVNIGVAVAVDEGADCYDKNLYCLMRKLNRKADIVYAEDM